MLWSLVVLVYAVKSNGLGLCCEESVLVYAVKSLVVLSVLWSLVVLVYAAMKSLVVLLYAVKSGGLGLCCEESGGLGLW